MRARLSGRQVPAARFRLCLAYVASTINLMTVAYHTAYSPIMAMTHQIFNPWGPHEFAGGKQQLFPV
jgi:hypothetical protein